MCPRYFYQDPIWFHFQVEIVFWSLCGSYFVIPIIPYFLNFVKGQFFIVYYIISFFLNFVKREFYKCKPKNCSSKIIIIITARTAPIYFTHVLGNTGRIYFSIKYAISHNTKIRNAKFIIDKIIPVIIFPPFFFYFLL